MITTIVEAIMAQQNYSSKELPFKQFLKCHSCGSTIVGEEKIRRYKNGKEQRFIYYHCSRQVKYDCSEPYVRDNVIVEELKRLSKELIADLNELEPGLKKAIEKYILMMRATHKSYAKKNLVPGYVKYVLEEGSAFEKTRLIRNLSIDLALHNRRLIKA